MQKKLLQQFLICLSLLVLLLAFCGCGTSNADTTADGNYLANVTLSGGSGRANVASPAKITIADGKISATIEWSSPYYDYMIVDDVTYENESEAGENSTFTIPISGFDVEIPVTADTTAMSVPHEIDYTLTFTLTNADYTELSWEEEPLSYATEFTVEKAGDYQLITIGGDTKYLVVPEDSQIPEQIPEDVTVLQQPLDQVYLVTSSAFDLVRQAGALGNIRLSGEDADDLYITEAQDLLKSGDMVFAGKYSAPDYELLLSEGCDLAIENTMILHNPDVLDKFSDLDIPYLIEHSSYESHPLGRLEWIKLYGILFDKEEEANSFYNEQLSLVEPLMENEPTGTTIAYFSLNSAGSVTVRKPGDYIAKAIELCGGEYALKDALVEEENALSTMKMQMEDFYAAAKDADVLIYNSAIEGEIGSIDDLLEENALFADFKAVQNGRVYCTSQNFFQETTGIGAFMEDLSAVCQNKGNAEFHYLIPLD